MSQNGKTMLHRDNISNFASRFVMSQSALNKMSGGIFSLTHLHIMSKS